MKARKRKVNKNFYIEPGQEELMNLLCDGTKRTASSLFREAIDDLIKKYEDQIEAK